MKETSMKTTRASILLVLVMLAAAGCSSVGGKVVKHEVKKAVPGVDTKGEKLSKKADRVTGDDEGGRRHNNN